MVPDAKHGKLNLELHSTVSKKGGSKVDEVAAAENVFSGAEVGYKVGTPITVANMGFSDG